MSRFFFSATIILVALCCCFSASVSAQQTTCNHGIRSNDGSCTCDFGWSGATCNICDPAIVAGCANTLTCPPSRTNPCSGHGVCQKVDATFNGQCVCDFGYTGVACNVCDPAVVVGCSTTSVPLPPTPSTTTTTCNHGIRSNDGSCTCDFGWSGTTCNICDPAVVFGCTTSSAPRFPIFTRAPRVTRKNANSNQTSSSGGASSGKFNYNITCVGLPPYRNNRMAYLIFAVGLFIIFATAIVLYLRNKNKAQRNEQQHQQQQDDVVLSSSYHMLPNQQHQMFQIKTVDINSQFVEQLPESMFVAHRDE